MNIIELMQALMSGIKFFLTTFVEVVQLLNPGYIEKVFKNIKPATMGSLRFYLVITALPIFFGYYAHMAYFQSNPYSTEISLKIAFRYYAIAIAIPIVMAYVLYLFDTRLLKAKITQAEALALFSYAISPALLSGVFRIYIETWILHLLIVMYSIYLLYASLGIRYGYEKVIMPFIFLLLVATLTSAALYLGINFALGILPGYQ
jgi:hypothetical protein